MLLTSSNRLYRYIGDVDNSLTSSVANDRLLLDWITAVSQKVEGWLDRSIQIAERTEYFDTMRGRLVYYPKAIPVTTLTSVYEDWTGLYSGTSESAITDSYIGTESRTIVLPYVLPAYPKGMRIVYTGGMAYHAVNSLFAIGSITSTMAVGDYVKGATSGAVGIVRSAVTSESTSVTIENLWGIFEASERVDKTSTEGGTAGGTSYFTISSITRQSLAEAYPAIVRAVEIECRYHWKHKHDFENSATSPDGSSVRSKDEAYSLQAETKAMLAPYRRLVVEG